jgi:phosphoglycerate kinase
MLKTIKDIDFKDKKVFLRVDYNVPINEAGEIEDNFRIKLTVPTINFILKQMPKQVIFCCHVGRPKNFENYEEHLKTNNIAKHLGKLIDMPIKKIDNWNHSNYDKNNPENCLIMLENIRFNPAEKSNIIEERDQFGKELATDVDVYVEDAFSNCHRDHASMTSVPKFTKEKCIGFLIEKELEMIKKNINNPEQPFISIIGGVKADKVNAIQNLLKTADKILIGSSLAMLFYKVAGKEIGKTKIDMEGVDSDTERIIKAYVENPKIILPVDVMIGNSPSSTKEETAVVSINDIPEDKMVLDIGPRSIINYNIIIKQAKTIVWNGPLGYIENKTFAKATKEIGEAIVDTTKNHNAKSIIGGGDGAAAAHKFGYADEFTHISSGGGASLKLFEGKELVALKVLEE